MFTKQTMLSCYFLLLFIILCFSQILSGVCKIIFDVSLKKCCISVFCVSMDTVRVLDLAGDSGLDDGGRGVPQQEALALHKDTQTLG